MVGGRGEPSKSITMGSLIRLVTVWGSEEGTAWDRAETGCVGLDNKEGALADGENLGGLAGGFFLKKDVILELTEPLLEASFLWWVAPSTWVVQLDSLPSPIFTLSLHGSQYLVPAAVNSDCF